MGASAVGTKQTDSVLFNSGYLTVGGLQVGSITNIVLNKNFTEKDIYLLGSIKAVALRRSHLKISCSFDLEPGLQRQLYALFYSASSNGASDTTYTVKDGQQTTATVMVTAYENDDVTKYYQWTLTNPMLTSHDETLQSENYGKVKVTILATDITLLTANAVSN